MPEFSEVKDSGERTQFATGSQRDSQEGKGRFDLIPFYPQERLAQHFENGARKYDDDNWKKGQPLRQYVNSAMRHLFKISEGMLDEDHPAAVAWNMYALMWTKREIDEGRLPAELDNIPWDGLESETGNLELDLSAHTLNLALTNGDRLIIDGGGMRIEGGSFYDVPADAPVETPVYGTGAALFDGPQSTGEGLEPEIITEDSNGFRVSPQYGFTSIEQADEFRALLADHTIAGLGVGEYVLLAKHRHPGFHNPENDAPR
jgi:hypothetical protein